MNKWRWWNENQIQVNKWINKQTYKLEESKLLVLCIIIILLNIFNKSITKQNKKQKLLRKSNQPKIITNKSTWMWMSVHIGCILNI